MLTVFVAGLALALTTRTDSSAHAQDMGASGKDARVAKIMAAWKKRQDAIHTVRATLDMHVVMKPGYIESLSGVPPPKKAKQQEVEYTRSLAVLLDFDNKRYRVDETGEMYSVRFGTPVSSGTVSPRKIISTFVNGEGKTLSHNVAQRRYQGAIGGERGFNSALGELGSMLPLLLYVRPCGGLPGLTTSWPVLGPLRVVSTGRSGSPETIECECAPGDPNSFYLLLDAKRDYAVVRIDWKSQRLQSTIDYGPDEGYGPVPTRSTFVVLHQGGGIMHATTTCVRNIEINVALTDSMFKIEFPEGTMVALVGTGASVGTGPGPPLRVAKASGQLVPPHQIEGDTHSRGTGIRVWIVAANMVILLVLAGFVLRRRLQGT